MTHVTDRKGSSQTLVCSKDRRTFERRMKAYRQEIAAMATPVAVTPKSDAPAALSARMHTAVGRAKNGGFGRGVSGKDLSSCVSDTLTRPRW